MLVEIYGRPIQLATREKYQRVVKNQEILTAARALFEPQKVALGKKKLIENSPGLQHIYICMYIYTCKH